MKWTLGCVPYQFFICFCPTPQKLHVFAHAFGGLVELCKFFWGEKDTTSVGQPVEVKGVFEELVYDHMVHIVGRRQMPVRKLL